MVRQNGGLGNQLFQYAAGVYWSQRSNSDLRVAALPKRDQISAGHSRVVLLDKFSLSTPVTEWTKQDRLAFPARRRYVELSAIYRLMAGVQIVTEPSDCYFTYYEPAIRKTSRIVYLVGFWQTFLIPRAIEQRLRSDLAFRHGPDGPNIDMGRRIGSASYPVSLHLRRGDYKKLTGFNVVPLEYYDQAIAEYRNRRRDATFFVFSDDHEFAREWVRDRPHLTLINQNNEETAHEDLRLMSSCRAHIIANSTFSWWAAWLNSKEDKQVIAPPTWLGNSTRDIQIIPPEWTILD